MWDAAGSALTKWWLPTTGQTLIANGSYGAIKSTTAISALCLKPILNPSVRPAAEGHRELALG